MISGRPVLTKRERSTPIPLPGPVKTSQGKSWPTSLHLIITTIKPLSARIQHRECPKKVPSGPSPVCSASSEPRENAIAPVHGKIHQSHRNKLTVMANISCELLQIVSIRLSDDLRKMALQEDTCVDCCIGIKAILCTFSRAKVVPIPNWK